MPGIYQHGETTYKLTETDIDTLARALWGEAGGEAPTDHYAAVSWTMIQRWLRWPGGNALDRWPSFSAFIKAFSQPVNPRWARGGDLAAKHPDYATPEMLARRDKIQNTPWAQIPPAPRLAAQLFAEGKLKNPVPEAVDFAADSLAKKKGLTGESLGGNTFVSADGSDMGGWSDELVTVGDGAPGKTMLAKFPIVLGLLGLVFLVGGKLT